MGVQGATVRSDSQQARISIETTDRPAAAVEAVCTDGTFVAPVIKKITGRPTTIGDPFSPVTSDAEGLLSGLGFDIPTTVAQLNALSPEHQRQLDALLNSITCAYPIVQAAPVSVACDNQGTVYLLGSSVVGSDELASAQAKLDTSWVVDISLTDAGKVAITKYTTAHNEQSSPGAVDNELVVVSLGRAVSLGPASQPITSNVVQISSDFTEDTAQRIASQIVPTPLPLPLHVVQLQQLTSAPTPTTAASS
jgi:hypothetical protein